MYDPLRRYPSAFGYALGALDFYLSKPKEIVIVRAGRGEGEGAGALAREVWKRYLPNKVVAQAAEGDEEAARLVPLLSEREARGGAATAYVCENYSCKQPVTSPGELAAQLDEV